MKRKLFWGQMIAAFLYIGVGLTYFSIRQRYQKILGYSDLKLYWKELKWKNT